MRLMQAWRTPSVPLPGARVKRERDSVVDAVCGSAVHAPSPAHGAGSRTTNSLPEPTPLLETLTVPP
jgi:hypothetical protein